MIAAAFFVAPGAQFSFNMLKWLKKKPVNPPEDVASAGAASGVNADAAVKGAEWRRQGNDWLSQDNFTQAQTCYENALALDPHDVGALVNLGFVERELGSLEQAVAHLQAATRLAPDEPDAFYFLGTTLERMGGSVGAIAALRSAVSIAPMFEPARQVLCRLLAESGQLEEARALLDDSRALYPESAWPYLYLGNLQTGAGQFAQAAESLRHATARAPQDAQLHTLLGTALQQQGALANALDSYRQATLLDPGHAEAFSSMGNVLRRLGQLEQAQQACERALGIDPSLPSAYNNLGAIRMAQGDTSLGLELFEKAISLQPDSPQSHGNRGVALGALKRYAEALASFDVALRLKPDFADALTNRGSALQEMGRLEDALASHDAALLINKADAETLTRRGSALHGLGRLREALESHQAALASQPDHTPALNNAGNLLSDMGRMEEAIAAYERALAIKPDYAQALFNRGNVLRHLNRPNEAIASYEQALAIEPDLPYLYGNWLHARMQACDWRGLNAHFSELARRVDGGQLFNPFTLMATPLSAAQQLHCAKVYAATRHPVMELGPADTPRSTKSRIRLGYFSADFHEHATAWLIAELFELHDRRKFELLAFSFGPDQKGPMRARLEGAFEQFHQVAGMSDREVAELARALDIDIAVDLKGYTQNSRPGIFAFRPAPVQVNYLGYPGTMGAPFVDYIIADATVVPDDHLGFYTEKVARLPGSYQVNDSRREISALTPTRAMAGLPETGFVFCCFNNSYKITPDLFGIWMRLLQQIEASVLWLLEANPLAAQRLRAEAVAHGVDPSRLVFASRKALPEHLARHRLADLFLDTHYCNAHTTASDALWAGLPVLTCLGQTFAGRVAASLSCAAGLPDMVVDSLSAYEALALDLARRPPRLDDIKARLARNRLNCPLFDTPLYAAHLEAALTLMWKRHESGLPPDHFSVV